MSPSSWSSQGASQSQSQVLYQPSPLEQAYGEYLLEQVFGIGNNAELRISGRDAVGFLSKSGVDRHILRTLWTVADPENNGNVKSVSQWMVLLRLVALAQSKYVSASAESGVSVEALQTILAQTSQASLPPAIFSGISVPDAQTLRSRQPRGGGQQVPQQQQMPQQQPQVQQQQQQQQVPQTPEPSGWGAMDALGSPSNDAPLSGMGMQTPTKSPQPANVEISTNYTPNGYNGGGYKNGGAGTPNGYNGGGYHGTNSGGGNNTPTDAPLSSLSLQSPGMSNNYQPSMPMQSQKAAVDDDFGDFESSSGTDEVEVGMSGWDAMDALAAGPADAPLPSLSHQNQGQSPGGMSNNYQQQSMMQSPNDNNADDDFGDFAGTNNASCNEAPSPAVNINASGVAPAVEVSGWGAMDALSAAPADAPLPSMSHQNQSPGMSNNYQQSVQPQNNDEDDDDFGHFAGTNNTSSNEVPVPAASNAAPAVEVSGWGALDALGAPTPDAPLPSMSHQNQSPGMPNNQSMQSPNSHDHDDDDFGDFESPSGSNEAAVEASGWDAMDALSAPTDAPLHSFAQQSPGMVSDTTMLSQHANDNDEADDDFGDFAGTNNTSSNEIPVPAASGVSPAAEVSGWGAMDALAAPTDAPLPSLSHQSPGMSNNQSIQSHTDDDDDFGDFESPNGGNEAPLQIPLDATAAPVVEASGWDAMDALAAPTDTPLPSIAQQSPGMMNDTTMQPQNANGNDDDDDDFGDFAGTNNTSSNETPLSAASDIATAVEASGWGAVNALTAPTDAPLPSQGNQSLGIPSNLSMQSPDDDDDEFGDFAATNSSEASVQPVDTSASDAAPAIEASGWDALDALAAPSNAPLPSLSHQSSGISSHQSMQSQDDDDDDFGDFVATSASNDTPIQPLDGTTSATTAPAVEASGWDALDDLAAPANAPLPSLGHQSPGIVSSTSMQSQDVDADDFGDFAGTSNSDEATVQPVGTTVSVTTAPTVEASGWDALDDLAAPSNAPLSGLSHQSSGISSHQSMQSHDDDDFGDFAGTGDSSEPPVLPVDTSSSVAASGWDALDGIPALANAPLPSLEHQSSGISSGISTSPSMQSQHDGDGDFGDFAGTASSEPFAAEEGAQPRAISDLAASGAVESNRVSGSDESHLIVDPTDSGDFGDFLGTESSAVQNNASSAFRSQPEDTSNGVHPESQESADSGHAKLHASSTKKPPLPPSGSRSVQNPPTSETLSSPYSMERTDSAFYSARTHSAATDDLGDFEDAVETSDEHQWPEAGQGKASPNETEVPHTVDSDDPFAAFDTVGSPPPTLPPLPPLPTFNLDSYLSQPDPQSEVASATKSATTSEEKDPDDEFGDFEAVPIQKGMGTDVVTDEIEDEMEDDFGDFAGFESGDGESNVEPGHQEVSQEANLVGFSSVPAQTQPLDAVDDDFGDFGDFEAPPNASEATNASAVVLDANGGADDFGDTQSVDAADKSSPSDVLAIPQEYPDVDDFGDFSSFGEVGSPPEVPAHAVDTKSDVKLDDPERQKLVFVRKYLVDQSQQLPEAFRTQLGKPGSRVDFGDCFDANIGLDTPVSENRKKRAQRCAQLLGLLSSTHSKMASTYWAQAIGVARDELTLGSVLLEEASGLSSAEKKLVQQALETMVFGLGEFVRVARLIVSSIGDLLMLDDTALLTIDTFASSWCSMAMLKGYLEVEKLWKNVEKLGKLLGLSPKSDSLFPLESLVEVRRRAAAAKSSERLCQFTLQPLSEVDVGKSTRAPVKWKGQPFMACTANFLVHKFVF